MTGLPEGRMAPALPDRRVWLIAEGAGAFQRGPRQPLLTFEQGEALSIARRWHGVVAELPIVADFRDDPNPAPRYRSRVVWTSADRERHPLTDPIPPGGPVVIEHQDTEDDGSVTIWFRRHEAG